MTTRMSWIIIYQTKLQTSICCMQSWLGIPFFRMRDLEQLHAAVGPKNMLSAIGGLTCTSCPNTLCWAGCLCRVGLASLTFRVNTTRLHWGRGEDGQHLLAMYWVPPCDGRGVELGSENSSAGANKGHTMFIPKLPKASQSFPKPSTPAQDS